MYLALCLEKPKKPLDNGTDAIPVAFAVPMHTGLPHDRGRAACGFELKQRVHGVFVCEVARRAIGIEIPSLPECLNRLIYEVYHEKIESVQVCHLHKETGIFDMQRRMACVQGMVYPLELGMVVRNGCTSHNSLSKDKSFSTSRKFSFLQRSLTSSSRNGVGQKTCRCD